MNNLIDQVEEWCDLGPWCRKLIILSVSVARWGRPSSLITLLEDCQLIDFSCYSAFNNSYPYALHAYGYVVCLPPIEIRYESEPKTQISERNKTIGESFARFLSREHLFKNPDHHRFVGTS